MALKEQAQTATYILKAGRGRRRHEQNGIEAGTDGNSRSESGAEKKAVRRSDWNNELRWQLTH